MFCCHHKHTHTHTHYLKTLGLKGQRVGERGEECQGWFCGWLPLCELVCATSKEIAIASHDATKCTEKGATNNRNNDSVNDNNKKGKTQQQQQDVDAAAAAAEPNQDWEKEAGGKKFICCICKNFHAVNKQRVEGRQGQRWRLASSRENRRLCSPFERTHMWEAERQRGARHWGLGTGDWVQCCILHTKGKATGAAGTNWNETKRNVEIASGAVAAAANVDADADGAALVPLWKCILKKRARAFVILILWIFSSLFCHFHFMLPTCCRMPHATKRPRLGSKKCFLIENVPSQLRLLIVGVAGPEEGT